MPGLPALDINPAMRDHPVNYAVFYGADASLGGEAVISVLDYHKFFLVLQI